MKNEKKLFSAEENDEKRKTDRNIEGIRSVV